MDNSKDYVEVNKAKVLNWLLVSSFERQKLKAEQDDLNQTKKRKKNPSGEKLVKVKTEDIREHFKTIPSVMLDKIFELLEEEGRIRSASRRNTSYHVILDVEEKKGGDGVEIGTEVVMPALDIEAFKKKYLTASKATKETDEQREVSLLTRDKTDELLREAEEDIDTEVFLEQQREGLVKLYGQNIATKVLNSIHSTGNEMASDSEDSEFLSKKKPKTSKHRRGKNCDKSRSMQCEEED